MVIDSSREKVTRQVGAMTLTVLSDTEIQITREFDAPRELVFEAHSKPEHMRNWWGPRRYEITVCEIDFRPGGKWRVVHRGADGEEFGFHGEYHEIVPPERITWTFEFEGAPGNVSIETARFEERDGKTLLTATAAYPSIEARDAVVNSGMETGAAETYDRLAEYLERMR